MAYKVVYEDAHKFHIQHPDGSQFPVAKKGLGKAALNKIQSMKVQKLADGGEVQPPMAMADNFDPLAHITEPLPADQQYTPVQDPSVASSVGNYLGSTLKDSVVPVAQAVGSVAQGVADPIKDVAMGFENGVFGNQPDQPGPNQVPMDPQTARAAQPYQPPQPTAPMAAAPSHDIAGMAGMPTTKDLDKIVGAQAGAEQASANAMSEGYKKQADVYNQAVQQQQDAMASFNQRLQKLDAEHERLTQSVANGHVDPNRLYNSRSTGQKIGTAISLILGGMGGGASGNNAGMAVMQNLINKDIEAQKFELGKNQTLLSENMKQYGNLYAAEAATRSQYAAIIQGQLGKVAAETNDPVAQANAKKAIAGIQLSTMPLRQQLAQHQMMMQMMGQINNSQQTGDVTPQQLAALRMVNPEMAKNLESRYIPGVGVGSIPVPDKVREELAGRASLQKQVETLRNWAQQHAGSLDPATMAYGNTLSKTVQDAYRRANGQGVFREAEAKFVSGIVNQNPTAFLNNMRVDPQYKALEDSNLAEMNTLKGAYGFKQTQGASPYEGKTAVNPQGQRVKMVSGRWVPTK